MATMKRTRLAFYAVFVLLSLAFIVRDKSRLLIQSRVPIVVFATTTRNVGNVPHGDLISQAFTFTNAGNRELTIPDVHAGCGCTATIVSASHIPPGESGVIEVKIDTKVIPVVLGDGMEDEPFAKTVTVTTNDPAHFQVVLQVSGKLVPDIAVRGEGVLDFGYVQHGTEIRKEVALKVMPGRNVHILGVTSTDEAVSVKTTESADTAKGEVHLIAIQRRDARPGSHYGNIVITTSSNLIPQLKIPVRGIIDDSNG
jgi:hypothetical protein